MPTPSAAEQADALDRVLRKARGESTPAVKHSAPVARRTVKARLRRRAQEIQGRGTAVAKARPAAPRTSGVRPSHPRSAPAGPITVKVEPIIVLPEQAAPVVKVAPPKVIVPEPRLKRTVPTRGEDGLITETREEWIDA